MFDCSYFVEISTPQVTRVNVWALGKAFVVLMSNFEQAEFMRGVQSGILSMPSSTAQRKFLETAGSLDPLVRDVLKRSLPRLWGQTEA